MRSCFVLSFALLVATISFTPPLRAQGQPTWQLYGGLGLEVVQTTGGESVTPVPALQFGVVRQVAGSRFGARLDATYVQRKLHYYEGTETALGASVGAMYDVGKRTWRPYVTSGIGMYELSPGGLPVARRSTGALIAGFGLRRAIGRVPVFGELRYHYFTNGQDFSPHRLFLTFGIRF